MGISRFDVLHRRFVRLVNGELEPVETDVIRKLIADTDAYFTRSDDPELSPHLSPFFLRSVIRGCATNLLERSAALPWHADIAGFVERLPVEERLADGTRFTSDYVTPFQASWLEALAPLVGAPGVRGLEVGSFEGRSAIWFLRNVLTEPTSYLDCVDTFDFAGQGSTVAGAAGKGSGLQDRFDQNLAAARLTDRVRKHVGRSQERLRSLPLGQYHFAYLDGSHLTCDVLEDVTLTWRLLKQGAVLIIDDYAYARNRYADTDADPGRAVDAFTACFAGQWSELHRGYQLILRKDAA